MVSFVNSKESLMLKSLKLNLNKGTKNFSHPWIGVLMTECKSKEKLLTSGLWICAVLYITPGEEPVR